MRFVSVYTSDGVNLYCNSNDAFSIAGAAMNLGVRHTRNGLIIKEKIFGGKNLATRPERAREFEKWVKMQETKPADIFHLIDVTADIRFGMVIATGDVKCQTQL